MAGESGSMLAVLIDADNTAAGVAQDLLTAVGTFGIAHVRRAYGDWTRPGLKAWKAQCLAHAIEPVQQLSYIRGKNATDMALVIDAMDLLHTGRFDGFCIVSSDSDFTPLATRVRQAGLLVYGFGRMSTPKPLVGACNAFTFLDCGSEPKTTQPAKAAKKKKKKAAKPAQLPPTRASREELIGNTTLMSELHSAVAKAVNGDGWAPLHLVGGRVGQQVPGFSTRSFGFAKLSALMTATALFELEERASGTGRQGTMCVREKVPAKAKSRIPV
jgi:uncharacterized LabA/DUF88 family protein